MSSTSETGILDPDVDGFSNIPGKIHRIEHGGSVTSGRLHADHTASRTLNVASASTLYRRGGGGHTLTKRRIMSLLECPRVLALGGDLRLISKGL